MLRTSPGAGAVLGPGGERLRVGSPGAAGGASRRRGPAGSDGMTDRARRASARSTTRTSWSRRRPPSTTPSRRYPPRTEREAEFYTLRDGEMFINLGPQHPSTHGVLRVVLKIDGERIVDLDPVLGYLHRGVEKICENGDWHHAISNCDPLEYIASMFSEALPVLAAEKLLDLEVPRRAEYIRVLAWELNRISSHALFIGWLALDLGGLTPILYGFIERDEIVEMLAALTGQKLLFNYLRIGGVNGDLNHEFLSRLGDWMSRAGKHIDGQATLINENEIFVNRTKGLGVIDRETALRLAMSGPPLRATGRALRRAPRAPLQRLPGARVRHPDAHRGRLLCALPAPHRGDQAVAPHHRPGAAPDARRAGHGQAAAPAARAAGPRLRRPREPARPVRRLRHQRRLATSPSGSASTTPRTSTCRRSAC